MCGFDLMLVQAVRHDRRREHDTRPRRAARPSRLRGWLAGRRRARGAAAPGPSLAPHGVPAPVPTPEGQPERELART